MNGPAHYQRAEELLDDAASQPAANDDTCPAAALLIAEAQVHATLANTAVLASALRDDLPQSQIDGYVKAGVL